MSSGHPGKIARRESASLKQAGNSVFIPIYDSIALRFIRRGAVTLSLVGLTTLIYACVISGLFGKSGNIDIGFGLIPPVLFGTAQISPDVVHAPAWMTLGTSIFIHGSVWHLGGNMLFLWVLGDNVEDAMGHIRFAIFFILCGACAGLSYALIFPTSISPLIGASGAISGIAAAYVLLYPKARIVGLLFNVIPVSLSAGTIIGLWIAYQLLSAIVAGNTQIGWWAHVGGILSGGLLLAAFKRPEAPWFGNRTE
jgi:membrane associated rhomboid family serine protease